MNEARLEKRLRFKPATGDMVEVEWTDSFYDTTSDATPEDYSTRVARLLTFGYFVKSGKDGFVVAMCKDMQSGSMRHFVTIPRVNVRAIHPCQRRASEP